MENVKHVENKVVDIAKLVMAFWIMISHTSTNSIIIRSIFGETNQIAVTVFFVITGYYLSQNGIISDLNRGRNYIVRLLQLFTWWMIIQWVWDLIVNIGNEYDFLANLNYYLDGLFTFTGYMQLWYLGAVIVCVSVLCVFRLEKPSIFLLILLGMLFVIHRTNYLQALTGLLWGEYLYIGAKPWNKKSLRISMALGAVGIFVLLVFHCRTVLGKNISAYNLHLIEGKDGIIVRLLTLAVAVSVSYLVLTCNSAAADERGIRFWYVCRKMSTIIFLAHYQIGISVVYFVENRINLQGINEVGIDVISALINGVFCLMAGTVLMRLSNRLVWLKRLY